MKLTRLSVETETAIVVDSVCNVRSLLDFCYETACSDGVDASCREEENITGLHLEIGKNISNGVVLHSLHILLWSNLLRKT